MTLPWRQHPLRASLARAAVAVLFVALLPVVLAWVMLCLCLMAAILPLLVVLLLAGAAFAPETIRMPGFRRRLLAGSTRDRQPVSNSDWEQAVREHSAWLESEQASGRRAEFEHRDLRGRSAHLVNLSGALFVTTDLSGVHFQGCRFRDADFDESTLNGSYFEQCRLEAASFYQADLSGADLRSSQGLSWRQLGGANLEGTTLPDSVAEFPTLDAVGQASAVARSAFLLLLAACIYIWLTTASTTDVALIQDSDSLALPIIGTQVSIEHFYFVAPALLLGVSIYFHLYLVRLCQLMTSVPAVFPDGRTLEQRVHPWLFNGLLSTQLPRLRSRTTWLQWILFVLSVPVIWGIVPLSLAYLWLRYLSRHQALVSYWHLALLVLAVAAAVASLYSVLTILRGRRSRIAAGKVFRGSLACLAPVGVIVALFGSVFTRGSVDFGQAGTVSLEKPEASAAWRNPETTHREFTRFRWRRWPTWGPSLLACLKLKPVIDIAWTDVSRKPSGWKGERPEDWSLVAGARLKETDLNYARAERAFLLGADLRGARLVGADLKDADLRLAELSEAILPHVVLEFADLRRAVLSRAILFHARLDDSRMDDCLLHFARLEHAELPRANLERAEMNGANLECAKLDGAKLNDAKASGARFGCGSLLDAELRGAVLHGASFVGANLTRTDLRCAVLVNADLRGATVTGIRLEGANLVNVILDEATRDALEAQGVTLDLVQIQPYDPDKDRPECCRSDTKVSGVIALDNGQ
ncbi:MAG: pentapeptide repeat-containing protein [Pirellulaceae bacterium]|nr:pentapeptide repeat-containing protein [Pirellulaceae bacterium]